MIEMKLRQVRPYALIFVELSTAMRCLAAVEPRTDRPLSMDCYRCPCTMMPLSILCGNGALIFIPSGGAQLKSLTFAALPKLTAADPVIHRRNKLIVRLQQQIALVQDPNFTLTRQKWITDEHGVKQLRELRKRVRPWWRTDATGAVVLTVRYGARVI